METTSGLVIGQNPFVILNACNCTQFEKKRRRDYRAAAGNFGYSGLLFPPQGRTNTTGPYRAEENFMSIGTIILIILIIALLGGFSGVGGGPFYGTGYYGGGGLGLVIVILLILLLLGKL
jgi:Protein of unknown function (DUF3309)